jgi:hypothetical protein
MVNPVLSRNETRAGGITAANRLARTMKLFILYFLIATIVMLDRFGGSGNLRLARDSAAGPVRSGGSEIAF